MKHFSNCNTEIRNQLQEKKTVKKHKHMETKQFVHRQRDE